MNKTEYFLLFKRIRDSIPESSRSEFDLQFAIAEKSAPIALILSLFFGVFGIDRFYIGQTGYGLLKLFTLGGLGLWKILDWFLIIGATRARNIKIANKLK
jgi:TM2 domain-containing membrane protein YozV